MVGGAIRGLLLGIDPTDVDFATDATPEEVTGLFRRVIPTGVRHGTVTVIFKGHHFEITTYRVEHGYSDRRRPDAVEFSRDILADLARRDFTMNAIALDVLDAKLIDPHGGRQDIEARVIRAIGDAGQRFAEDALRMLRAVRFAAQLEFELDAGTMAAIGAHARTIAAVSCERIRDELTKTLQSERPSRGLFLLRDCGLLAEVLPELAEGVGVEQRGNHRFDVFTHSAYATDAAPREELSLRLAALLHDVGKPRCLTIDPSGERRFSGHDTVSSQMAREILRRLRYPVSVEKTVAHLIMHHMFSYTPEWSDAAVRRFVSRVGPESVEPLLSLRGADGAAVDAIPDPSRPIAAAAALEGFRLRIERVLAADHALGVKDLAIDGNDLADAGIPRGPAMGTILDFLLEAVLDDPRLNTPQKLIKLAVNFYRERIALQ